MRKREKESLEDQIASLNSKTEGLVEKEREKCEEKIAELQRKQANEIKKIKEEENISKEQWMETYQHKFDEQKAEF
jgi:hypothetical protein